MQLFPYMLTKQPSLHPALPGGLFSLHLPRATGYLLFTWNLNISF